MKEVIATNDAPLAVGPYSQGIRAGRFAFTSGQLPATLSGEVISDDITKATRQSLNNVKAVLSAAGVGMTDVVKVTVFLTDMADFAQMNEVYAGFFSEPFPARSCIQVAALPKGARVEIEATACLQ
ncbi:RidA family protein [Candidatus Bipolaricaulota bacterium]|nr:RidA family protein [Candidatus Bipolaricaulota bacterium]